MSTIKPRTEVSSQNLNISKKGHLQKLKKNTADYFAVSETDADNATVWENRRLRIANSIGHGVNESYLLISRMQNAEDQDGDDTVNDQAFTPGRPLRKKSVVEMSISAIKLKSGRDKGPSSAPVSPGHVADDSAAKTQKVSSERKSVTGYSGSSGSSSRRKSRHPTPTPRKLSEEFEFNLSQIKSMVIDMATKRKKRHLGMGNVGELLERKLRTSIVSQVTQQINNLDDYRPYFTYWITFVQTVILITSLIVYGFAPFGIGTTQVPGNVRMPNLAIQTEYQIERDNMWIGPRQADLIHLGAKYSPCMRVDASLSEAIGYDTEEESNSACCIRKDGSGCAQTVKAGCDTVLSIWNKWSSNSPGPDGRISGSVCGQDPRYCIYPSSSPPFEWPDQITRWPICITSVKVNQSMATVKGRHMRCEILGRPCCFGIQGECIITTYEHCSLLRGYFHSDAALCSQVNCFQEICGMIPFANPQEPDQFYRLFSSLFLHGGLVHLIITIIFQMWIMRDLEKLLGAFRTIIVYFGSGMAGNLASCTFIPYQVEVGPSGAQFGIAACLLVEVIQSYQMYKHPYLALLKLLMPIFCFFLLGLLPWFDNWAHIFGFFFGFLLAFSLMPYVTFGHFDRRRKLISVLMCLGAAVGLFIILVIIFYHAPLTKCEWCVYLNCIPITQGFCDNMAVKIKTNSTYSKYADIH